MKDTELLAKKVVDGLDVTMWFVRLAAWFAAITYGIRFYLDGDWLDLAVVPILVIIGAEIQVVILRWMKVVVLLLAPPAPRT